MENRQEVITVLVRYECDVCKDGTMQYKEMMLPSQWGGDSNKEEPKWIHECTDCGATKIFDVKYPFTEYRYY